MMKNISKFIVEKLIINKNSKFINDNLDHLNNIKCIMWNSDNDEEDNFDVGVDQDIYDINDKYDGFIYCKFDSLSELINNVKKTKDDSDLYSEINIEFELEKIMNTIITGRDYGYELRLVYGHLELDSINSGSRATTYIYALKNDGLTDLEWIYSGEASEEESDIIGIINQNIVPIEL